MRPNLGPRSGCLPSPKESGLAVSQPASQPTVALHNACERASKDLRGSCGGDSSSADIVCQGPFFVSERGRGGDCMGTSLETSASKEGKEGGGEEGVRKRKKGRGTE